MMLRWLPLLLVLAIAPLAAAATPSPPNQPIAPYPPKPKVTTLGVTKYASPVSWCFQADGQGVCADGAGGSPKSTIAWRAGREVRIDFRLPAREVSVQTVHIAKPGAPPTGEVKLRVKRLDKTGRRYGRAHHVALQGRQRGRRCSRASRSRATSSPSSACAGCAEARYTRWPSRR